MTQTRRVLSVLGVFGVSLFFAIHAQAAEEAANPAKDHATEIFKWINFAIVVALLAWVFGKLLPPLFRKNADNISSEITKATTAKAQADTLLREAEAKLANLRSEVAKLRAFAEQESATEVQRIHTGTQTEAQKISAAAKSEIEATERAARLELKELAAKLAVDGAESLLAQQLTPQAQESLINNFVKSLDGRPN